MDLLRVNPFTGVQGPSNDRQFPRRLGSDLEPRWPRRETGEDRVEAGAPDGRVGGDPKTLPERRAVAI